MHLVGLRDFDQLRHKTEFMDMGEFAVFCRDFKVPLRKTAIIQIFKTTAEFQTKPLPYHLFTEAVNKIGIEMNKLKIEEIKK